MFHKNASVKRSEDNFGFAPGRRKSLMGGSIRHLVPERSAMVAWVVG